MRIGILAVLLFIPWVSSASVMINEIAWMGTTAGANEEWIELYNDGADSDVNGWTLTDSGSLSITLQGSIPAHSYALLERTDDETVSSISAFQLYTGALSNTGTTLTLRDSNGNIIDKVTGGENWENIGGDNITKDTPQRGTTSWVTSAPTPGRENVHGVGTSDDDEATGTVKGATTTEKDEGPGARISLMPSTNELQLSIVSPEIVYVNQSINFSSIAQGIGPHLLDSLSYAWNFGDTYTATGKKTSHTYRFPGEYLVVLNGTVARHDISVQKRIHVLPVTLTLSRTTEGNLVIENTADHDIDLSGYALRGTQTLTFSSDTILLSGGSITIDKKRIEILPSSVVLKDTEGKVVASEAYVTKKSPEPATILAVARTNSKTIAQKEPLELVVSDTAPRATSSSLVAQTIPVYATGDRKETENNTAARLLPYVGLAGLIVVGTLFLYRRRDMTE